jgi:hypothetical protein
LFSGNGTVATTECDEASTTVRDDVPRTYILSVVGLNTNGPSGREKLSVSTIAAGIGWPWDQVAIKVEVDTEVIVSVMVVPFKNVVELEERMVLEVTVW